MFLWSTAVSGMTGPHPHKNCDMLPADVAVATWVRVMSLSLSLNGSLGMYTTGLGYPFAHLADERTQSWPLVASPWSACLILALYLLLVHGGPRCMARWVWHTHCQHCANVSPLSPSLSLFQSQAAATAFAIILLQFAHGHAQCPHLPGALYSRPCAQLQCQVPALPGEL